MHDKVDRSIWLSKTLLTYPHTIHAAALAQAIPRRIPSPRKTKNAKAAKPIVTTLVNDGRYVLRRPGAWSLFAMRWPSSLQELAFTDGSEKGGFAGEADSCLILASQDHCLV